MMQAAFSELIAGTLIKHDSILEEILLEIEKQQDLFWFVPNFMTRKIEYVSESFEKHLGYTAKELIAKGPELLYEITEKTILPRIIEKQLSYTREVKTVGYDPYSVKVLSLPTVLYVKNGPPREFDSMCVVLTYSEEGEFESGVTIYAENDETTIEKGRRLLQRVKERHNEIHRHPALQVTKSPLQIVHITSHRLDNKLTFREKEVLKFLAQGMSTKEIGDSLHITSNTVETYRKNLLEKFEAKNSAELIKKASKVFWLE